MNQCCQIEWESMMPGTQALIDDPSAHHGEAFHLRSASPFRSTPPRHLCKSPSCLPSPGQADQPEFPEALQGGPPHQAAPAGLHHPHPALDLRAVLQGRTPVSKAQSFPKGASQCGQIQVCWLAKGVEGHPLQKL